MLAWYTFLGNQPEVMTGSAGTVRVLNVELSRFYHSVLIERVLALDFSHRSHECRISPIPGSSYGATDPRSVGQSADCRAEGPIS